VDCRGWLRRGQELENAAGRVREERWGPRTLDVDVIACHDGAIEVTSADAVLTLPHPFAHERAFVLVPWLALDSAATLTVAGETRSVAYLLDAIDKGERDGVRPGARALPIVPADHGVDRTVPARGGPGGGGMGVLRPIEGQRR
jgi:2-amino-4-hydroxy-6-hydroxymethyldihydropteridine diphosphokinase